MARNPSRETVLEDAALPWWEATATDNFDINQKLLRVGCRPVKRKLLECRQTKLNTGYGSCVALRDIPGAKRWPSNGVEQHLYP